MHVLIIDDPDFVRGNIMRALLSNTFLCSGAERNAGDDDHVQKLLERIKSIRCRLVGFVSGSHALLSEEDILWADVALIVSDSFPVELKNRYASVKPVPMFPLRIGGRYQPFETLVQRGRKALFELFSKELSLPLDRFCYDKTELLATEVSNIIEDYLPERDEFCAVPDRTGNSRKLGYIKRVAVFTAVLAGMLWVLLGMPGL